VNFNAPPTVGKFLGSDAFVRMLIGPVGSGKSSGCCVEIIRRAIETPPMQDGIRRSRWAIVRNTYPELRDTTIKTFKEWVPEPTFGTWKQSEHTFELNFETDDGARVQGEVMFRALDRPQDVKKLLSLELTGCYFNETKEIPKSIFDHMQGRVGRYPRKEDVSRYWTGVFGDTNPPDTDHYLYRLFEEEKPEGFERFKQPGGRAKDAENTSSTSIAASTWTHRSPEKRRRSPSRSRRERLARGEHERVCRCYYVRQCAGKSKDYISVMVDGNYGFVKEGKRSTKSSRTRSTLRAEPIPLLPNCRKLLIGNDYGLTPAAVWVQQDPADGQYQVIREFVSERLGAVNFGKEQARICKTEFKTIKEFEGWGDPAGMGASPIDEQDTPIDVVNAQGVPMTAANTNDPVLRREAVAICSPGSRCSGVPRSSSPRAARCSAKAWAADTASAVADHGR
jgi:hypothetical protein